jgi:hypothetical protein
MRWSAARAKGLIMRANSEQSNFERDAFRRNCFDASIAA